MFADAFSTKLSDCKDVIEYASRYQIAFDKIVSLLNKDCRSGVLSTLCLDILVSMGRALAMGKDAEDEKAVGEDLVKLFEYNELTPRRTFWVSPIGPGRWSLCSQILPRAMTSKTRGDEICRLIGLFPALRGALDAADPLRDTAPASKAPLGLY